VLEHDIRYIADIEGMFSELLSTRGGYSDGLLYSSLTPLRVFAPEPKPAPEERKDVETLYEVNHEKLAARGDCVKGEAPTPR
jgi:hypothetical protein